MTIGGGRSPGWDVDTSRPPSYFGRRRAVSAPRVTRESWGRPNRRAVTHGRSKRVRELFRYRVTMSVRRAACNSSPTRGFTKRNKTISLALGRYDDRIESG